MERIEPTTFTDRSSDFTPLDLVMGPKVVSCTILPKLFDWLRIDRDLSAASRLWYSFLIATA